jgi:hypothetical protein
MSEFFRPKHQKEKVPIPLRIGEETADNILTKSTSPNGEAYTYGKYITIDDTRYFIEFAHSKNQHAHELSIHFGLAGIHGSPVTNAGLEVFGKIADELSKSFEEISAQEKVERLLIKSSRDSYSKSEAERAAEIIAEDPKKLDGFMLSVSSFELVVNDGVAIIHTHGRFGVTLTDSIPVSVSFIEDIKRITKVDISDHIPEILNYLRANLDVNEKQIQRLKLYQFYLHKRYPQFTFNSKVKVDENGKRKLEFETYKGEPYLLVTTNTI